MIRKSHLLLLFLLLSCTLVSAKSYHITLLTVGETGTEVVGGTADAYLEIKPGSGRIFLDSFPLTKIDTQISTRYANKIACDFLDMDCLNNDFFYTIRADSTIVGGPSASASMTVLTIAALKGITLRNDTVMTGTINSGGSIGPVGGIVKKAEAAEKAGFKMMLVPRFSIDLEEGAEVSNKSLNLTIIGINVTRSWTNRSTNETKEDEVGIRINGTGKFSSNISVIKISNLEDALSYFTDEALKQETSQINVPSGYTETMRGIADALCRRAVYMKARTSLNNSEINRTNELMAKINKSLAEENYYSEASYCFNLGVLLRKASFREIEMAQPSRLTMIKGLTMRAVDDFSRNLEGRELNTLSELEAYVIVKERLLESEALLSDLDTNFSADDLAYAVERYYSAVFWSDFFSSRSRPVELDQKYLEDACYKKLSEAEERINYAELYAPFFLDNSRESLEEAYSQSKRKNYKMCLFKASYAKAESNLILSSISVDAEQINELAYEKLDAARKLLAKEQSRGWFPIMGYSYYEYANSLNKHNDSISGLIFSEYALELGNIEMYFPRKKPWFQFPSINRDALLLAVSAFSLGATTGLLAFTFVIRRCRQRNEQSKRSRRQNKR
ncbi:MAG: S16 family serine protease [archaeon]